MNATQKPYELLLRWGQDGNLRGAHMQWATVVSDDAGAVIGCYPGNVEPVAIAPGQPGFPLTDILSQVQADALTALTAAQEKAAALEDRLSAANSQISTLQLKFDAIRTSAEALPSRIEPLNEPLSEIGLGQ